MPFAIPSRSEMLSTVETLAIGAVGAMAFAAVGIPGGQISGAMIAVAIAAVAGRSLRLPPVVAQTILVVLGISLGSVVTKDLLANMSAYPLTIALLAVSTLGVAFGCSLYLQRVHGWDRTSAFLAGTPGALSQIMVLAHEKQADVPGVAVVQTIRVIILTACLPLFISFGGLADHTAPGIMLSVASPQGLAMLVAVAVATGWLLKRAGFPAGWMFGAMLASSVLHGGGWIEGGVPPWSRSAALIGIGALIGTRFTKISLATIAGYVKAALGSFAVAISVSLLFVGVVMLTTTVRAADVVIAFSPGAIDAMLALALTLHIDPVFVTAHHLARFIVVSVATPGIVQLFARPQQDADD